MRLFPHRNPAPQEKGPTPIQLDAAYAVCRSISRAAARNFYYSFLVLPPDKRNAICAVYAFMRHADDISDDPNLAVEEKREKLADWLHRLRRVLANEPTDDPVLLAVGDAQRRYDIPIDLLEKLVAGTAMDLADTRESSSIFPLELRTEVARDPIAADQSEVRRESTGTGSGTGVVSQATAVKRYATFDDLYHYCYHVASVVGLVCIRIFGYRDASAEPLAEKCGVAFQLTNIIRDVKEDASMGRIYLPQEDLDRFACDATELDSLPGKTATCLRPVLEFECQRARELYRSADQLLPLIDEDSRPALWVLVTIYRKLLEKIAMRNYDVFTERVRLTTPEKLRVLAQGFWLRLT